MLNQFRKLSPGTVLYVTAPALLVLFLINIWAPTEFHQSKADSLALVPVEKRVPVDLKGSFSTPDGRHVSFDSFQGHVLFLNLWATWCGPCRAEMPTMAKLYEGFSGDAFAMVALSDEEPAVVSRFLEANPFPFHIWLDSKALLMKRFGITTIPATLIIDSKGRLANAHFGYRDWSAPESWELVRQLLQE